MEAGEGQLKAVRRQYADLLWRYLAHLYRSRMTSVGIARWMEIPVGTVERRISSVPTVGTAAIAEVEQETWSAYVTRSQAPAPDDHVGREPVWHLSTPATSIPAPDIRQSAPDSWQQPRGQWKPGGKPYAPSAGSLSDCQR